MYTAAQTLPRASRGAIPAWGLGVVLSPLQGLIAAPALLFLITMALMLFHSPDSPFPPYDRWFFGLLALVGMLRACILRKPLKLSGRVTWPMSGLLLLALYDVLAQPYQAETWSMFAAKWLVPFVLYELAVNIFDNDQSLRQFETFSLFILAYLCLIAILFMVDLKAFVFPRYILDENLGIHADRARGPFLQAVANGVTVNLLGLLALNSYRRKRLKGVPAFLLLSALPLAILATRTRAVWVSFAGSILILLFFFPARRLRRACIAIVVAGALGLAMLLVLADHHRSLNERLEESGPVKFRMAVYEAGWEMFLMKPLTGWGGRAMQAELSSRISDFHQERYYFHNTYLEILVQYGVIGLGLYLWMVIDLFRLGRKWRPNFAAANTFLDEQFRLLWPVMVIVYLINGSFVVMNYQFVNGFLFTLAGMLVAQNRLYAQEVDAPRN